MDPQKESNIKVSIIITAYRSEAYVEECLLSIQKQTFFKNNKDYEILVGIDSCDKTLEKVVSIKEKIDNIKIFYSEKNVGTYILRNSLANQSNGKYLLFFDSDDILCEGAVEKLLSLNDRKYIRFKFINFIESEGKKVEKGIYKGYAHGVFWILKTLFKRVGGFQPWFCGADSEFHKRCGRNMIRSSKLDNVFFSRRIHGDGLNCSSNTFSGPKSKLRDSYRKLLNSIKDWSIPISPVIVDLEEI